MELLQLRYFCAAAECENFSATAKRYCVPPSDISQSVKRLERELGVLLFSRRANKISLNEEGRAFYERVQPALRAIDGAAAGLTASRERGRIRICINTNRRIVLQTIEGYQRRYPDVEIVVTHLSSPLGGEFDLIVDSEPPGDGYVGQLLVKERILLAVNRAHRLAAVEPLALSALSEEPFVTMGERSGLYALIRKICAEHGFSPHIVMQSDDPFYIRKCVELGLGVTLMPEFSWRGQLSPEVVLRPIGDYDRCTYAYLPNGGSAPCVESFVRMLVEECRR